MSGRGPAGRSSGGGRGGRDGRGRGGRRGGRGRGRNNNNKRSSGRGGGGTVPMDVENNDTTTTIPASGFDNSMSTMQQQKPSQQLQQNQKQPATMQTTTNSGGNEKKQLAHITNHKFAELQISAESRRALSTVFKYEYMTTVQAETLPLILSEGGNKDCLAKAKTGTGASLLLCVLLLIFYNSIDCLVGLFFSIVSLTTIFNTPILCVCIIYVYIHTGKTLAFMIPTIELIISKNNNKQSSSSSSSSSDIYCLVISPTRELAQQISTETEKLLTFHHPNLRKVVTLVGGTNKNKDIKALRGKVPIVVATPGRLLDHLQNSNLNDRMANLDCLILDEADQLLDMGFRPGKLKSL